MIKNLIELPIFSFKEFGKTISHKYRLRNKVIEKSYEDTFFNITALSKAFEEKGIKKNDKVSFFINNRYEWILTDFAIQALSAIGVPRGSDTSLVELLFIFRHSESSYLILENVLIAKELTDLFEQEDWDNCKGIFIVDKPKDLDLNENLNLRTSFYSDLWDQDNLDKSDEKYLEDKASKVEPDDLTTIIYTSGTTGNPKGVMLTHQNFIQNIITLTPFLEVKKGGIDSTVVMLPSWHVFERTYEYCCLYAGVRVFYSKPVLFANDLAREKPTLFITVPRVWESIYQGLIKEVSKKSFIARSIFTVSTKVRIKYLRSLNYLRGSYLRYKKHNIFSNMWGKFFHSFRVVFLFPAWNLTKIVTKGVKNKMGGNVRAAVCGAGALPIHLDQLFNSLGITICNAYGMTECAPGIIARSIKKNAAGTAGFPFDNTEVKILTKDGSEVAVGEKGVLYCRGPQVMKGYYKNEKATKEVLSEDGWLNTGDLAMQSASGEYVLVGREKDTIVLSSGENIEPEHIENKLKESPFIEHVIVVGNDRQHLGAMIAINEKQLEQLAGELKLDINIARANDESIVHDKILERLKKEVAKLISKENGFRNFEMISKITAIKHSFKIGDELTQSLKIKRKFIEDKYKELLDSLYSESKDLGKKMFRKKKKYYYNKT